MMTKARLSRVAKIALPIMGGMASTSFLTLVDTAMVGSLGKHALAAVGLAGFVYGLIMAAIRALALPVQAMTARRSGEGDTGALCGPVNAGVALAFALGGPATLAIIFAAPYIMPLLHESPIIAAEGAPYLQALAVGMIGAALNSVFRGLWNGTGRSVVYMNALLAMHAVNILLNYMLIFGNWGAPRLGAMGAGVGSAASIYVGAAYYWWMAWREYRGKGFLAALPVWAVFRNMLRMAAPSSFQAVVNALGSLTLGMIYGRMGAATLAAYVVLLRIMTVMFTPAAGLGMAGATLAGQALGRGDGDDAQQWGQDLFRLALAGISAVGLIMTVFPRNVLGIFIQDPSVLALATTPMRILGLCIGLICAGYVLRQMLLGVGDNRRVMLVGVGAQWAVIIPVVWLLVWLQTPFLTIWLVFMAITVARSMMFWILWRGANWKHLEF